MRAVALMEAVEKAIRRLPQERYPSAVALRDALADAARRPGLELPFDERERSMRAQADTLYLEDRGGVPARKRPHPLVFVAIFAGLLLVAWAIRVWGTE
jgi:hypothetical protein